jgi:threonine dehydrogenase-like Zn-dependent dehydrogenase
MKALRFERSLPRFAAAKVVGMLAPGRGADVGPLHLVDDDAPALPGPDWVRVRPRLSGICGSDLATIDGASSRYFEPIVSFPFVPGHEVVGELDDGSRVVVIPVLHCAVRGIDPVCEWCATGQINRCERVAFGHIDAGLQTGFCADTGGGWSTSMVAHRLQLVPVPDDLTDEEAVLIEPTACAVHAARAVGAGEVAVIGSGSIGLLTIAALRHLGIASGIVATARYPEQRRLAGELGAETVTEPGELERVIRRRTGSLQAGGQLTGGIASVVDCVGSSESLAQALRIVAPGGTVHVVGMPATVSLDLTSLWHREVAVVGRYAYVADDFATAAELVKTADLGRLVSATYPLHRYSDAIRHAAEAGRRGAVKIAFDLRNEKRD